MFICVAVLVPGSDVPVGEHARGSSMATAAAMFPSDIRAIQFLDITAKAGLRVPDDVSVTVAP